MRAYSKDAVWSAAWAESKAEGLLPWLSSAYPCRALSCPSVSWDRQLSTCLLHGSVFCGGEGGCELSRDLGLSCLCGKVTGSIGCLWGGPNSWLGLAQWAVLELGKEREVRSWWSLQCQ